MKKLQIVILVLCLGLFILPKNSLYAQNAAETCCKSEKNTKDCCKNEHKKESSHEGCKDHCCKACHTCCSFAFFSADKSEKIYPSLFTGYFQKPNFNYSTPYYSSFLKKIWQPPKIG